MVLYSLLFLLINITNVHLIMMLIITKNYQSVVSFPQAFSLRNVVYIYKNSPSILYWRAILINVATCMHSVFIYVFPS